MLYVTMFDEVDEGTAMFKLAPTAAQLPLLADRHCRTGMAIVSQMTGIFSSAVLLVRCCAARLP